MKINNSVSKLEESIVRMMPKGMVTIPLAVRKQWGLDAEKKPYLRVKSDKDGIRLEPVQIVAESELRTFSSEEVESFLEQDRLDSSTIAWVHDQKATYDEKD